MKTFKISEITNGASFSKPVFLDEGFILAAAGMPIQERFISALEEWNYEEVLCDGEQLVSEETNEESDELRLNRADNFYTDLVSYTENLYKQLAAKGEIDIPLLMQKSSELCAFIAENRSFILRVIQNQTSGKAGSYIATHCAETAILSVVIAGHLSLDDSQLADLAAAALIHEAGMVKLPPEIYLSDEALSERDFKALRLHPVLGYNLLRSLNLDAEVCFPALQHHERENGKGYPGNLSGKDISLYSKIIALACSYEALSAKRPFRDAKDSHRGILELLKNEGKPYDDRIVRALVFSLSIYPIGVNVMLSDGRNAQVVDNDPADPRYPIVQVKNGERIQTGKYGLSIARVLSKSA
jgi:HD-GYP domain-containing protein (c-di-GMP phosphodiesterase class II)